MDQLTHGEADNNGVKIHYVTMGEGPVVVMIHGFPDFWYSWRNQMPALAEDYQVVAMDQRGYNKSDKPKGQENYDATFLVSDVLAVVKAVGAEKATIVGHDWGGFVAWSFAMAHPNVCERLIICNLPHPKGLGRELATNPAQQASSAYAQAFQQPGAHKVVSKAMLAMSVSKGDPEALEAYTEAFERSDLEAMLHYYKQNYPKAPYEDIDRDLPPVKCPTLVFHGLADKALLPAGLNDTWDWVEAPLTIVTIPGADHWVHHDAADYVTETMQGWLKLHAEKD
jgi:pimeloyl-ACP methyl ester carboxylesterase